MLKPLSVGLWTKVVQLLLLMMTVVGGQQENTLPRVLIYETITTTVLETSTTIILTGAFVANYNIVEITNRKGEMPDFFLTNYAQPELYSETWTTPTVTTTIRMTIGKHHCYFRL
jgi:hypothetical protein